MSLNNTPSAERTHIGIFGRRNAGKSSLINALTSQSLAIVSDIKGTTTDPVTKAMELLPLGPVVLIDTPGLDDTGELGKLRIQKAYQMLNKTDIAVLVVDGPAGLTEEDRLPGRREQSGSPPGDSRSFCCPQKQHSQSGRSPVRNRCLCAACQREDRPGDTGAEGADRCPGAKGR